MIMTFIFLDQRRVQANSAWVGAGRKDARKDKHVADEEGRLHVVVRVAASLVAGRKGVSVGSSIILNSSCRICRNNRFYDGYGICNIQSRSIRRTRMTMLGHLRDRELVRLLTDLRAGSVERGRDLTLITALTDDTEDATCRIREVERRGRSTELGSNDVIQKWVLCLQKGATIAFQPAKMVISDKGHFDIARNGLLVRAERGGTTEDRSHGSTRKNILSAISQ